MNKRGDGEIKKKHTHKDIPCLIVISLNSPSSHILIKGQGERKGKERRKGGSGGREWRKRERNKNQKYQ